MIKDVIRNIFFVLGIGFTIYSIGYGLIAHWNVNKILIWFLIALSCYLVAIFLVDASDEIKSNKKVKEEDKEDE